MGAVRMRVLTADKNITIIHKYSKYQEFGLSFWRHPFTAEDPGKLNVFWLSNKLIHILDGLRLIKFSANLHFWETIFLVATAFSNARGAESIFLSFKLVSLQPRSLRNSALTDIQTPSDIDRLRGPDVCLQYYLKGNPWPEPKHPLACEPNKNTSAASEGRCENLWVNSISVPRARGHNMPAVRQSHRKPIPHQLISAIRVVRNIEWR